MDILNQLILHLENDECDQFIEVLNQNPGIDLNTIFWNYKYTLLHAVTYHGKIELVRELISRGSDINLAVDGFSVLGMTSFQYFCNSSERPKFHQIIKFLIESGAACNLQGGEKCYILDYFGFGNDAEDNDRAKEIVELLLDHGADRDFVIGEHTGPGEHSFNRDDFKEFVHGYQTVPGVKGVFD